MPHLDDGTLHAYLDGELRGYDPAAAREAEAHLARCEACRARLEQASGLRAETGAILAGAVPGGELDAPAFETLSAGADRSAGEPVSRSATAARWRRIGWAATVALAVSAGWYARDLLREPTMLEAAAESPGTDGLPPADEADAAPPADAVVEAELPAVAAADAAADTARLDARARVEPPTVAAADQTAQEEARVRPPAESAAAAMADAAEAARAAPPPVAAAADSTVVAERAAREAEEAARRTRVAAEVEARRRAEAMRVSDVQTGRADMVELRARLDSISQLIESTRMAIEVARLAAETPRIAREREYAALRPDDPRIGCYLVELGEWEPERRPGNQIFQDPPAFFRLDSTRGESFFEVGRLIVRPVIPAGRTPSAFWEPLLPDSVSITWTDGLSGVRVRARIAGDSITGRATAFTFGHDLPQPRAELAGTRIDCAHLTGPDGG